MRLAISIAGILAWLFVACSSGTTLSLTSDQAGIGRSAGQATFLLVVDGLSVDEDAIELRSVPVTAITISEVEDNRFELTVADVSAPVDAVDFRLEARVNGTLAGISLPFVDGTANQVQVSPPVNVSADAVTVPVAVYVYDALGQPTTARNIKVDANIGQVVQIGQVAHGEYEVVLSGLTDTTANPVSIEIIADSIVGTGQTTILVGELAGFDVERLSGDLTSAQPGTLKVLAQDAHGNDRTSFDGVVRWQAFDFDGAEIPIFPVKSNSFNNGELIQNVSFGRFAVDATMVVEADGSGIRSTSAIGAIGRDAVRCMEIRREGLKSRIITADEGASPSGIVFNAYLFSLSCEDIAEREDNGENIISFTIQGIEPRLELINANGKVVGSSLTPGRSASDLIDNLRQTNLGYYEVPLYDLTNVGESPYQLVATVGSVAASVQVEITPGEFSSLSIDRIPTLAAEQVATPSIYTIYVTARDSQGNQVLTENAAVNCNYVSGANALVNPIALPNMTLGRVAFAVAPPVNTGPETLQCWHGASTFATAPQKGERAFNIASALTILPADPLGNYVEKFAVVLPGQTYDNDGTVSGSPTPQVAGEKFEITVHSYGGLALQPNFTGKVYVQALQGGLTVYDGDTARSDSPISPALGDYDINNGTRSTFTVSLNTAGLQIIGMNQGDTISLPVPGPRSNIGIFTTDLPQNSSSIFQVRSAEFDHFEIAPISSPQIVNNAFVLSVEAVDANGNRVIGYNSSVEVADASGGLNASVLTFNDGIAQIQVAVDRAYAGNRVTVEAGDGFSAQSTVFDVRASTLVDHFEIYASEGNAAECSSLTPGTVPVNLPAMGSVTSAQDVSVLIVALDQQGKIADISWPLALTDSSSTVTPTTTDRLYRGCLVQNNVSIRRAGLTQLQASLSIAGTDAAGTSQLFTVTPGAAKQVDIAFTSQLPVIRDTGLLVGNYKIYDAAGNAVPLTSEVTISDTAGALSPLAVTSTPTAGEATFAVEFDAVANDNRLKFSVFGTSITTAFSPTFDVIVLPDEILVEAGDGSAVGTVTAYTPFSIRVIAKLNGAVLDDFVQPVSLAVVGDGTSGLESSPALSGGGVTFDTWVRTDSTTGTRQIRAYYSGPFGEVEGFTNAFSIGSTAYVDVGPVPSRVDDGQSFTVNFTAYNENGVTISTMREIADLTYHSGPLQGQNCAGALNNPDDDASLSPPTISSWTAGAAGVSVRIALDNAQNPLAYFGCIGATLKDSDETIFSEEIILCGDNYQPPFLGANVCP